MDRRELRKLDKELSKIGGFGEPRRPAHRGKDFLGAVVTLAIFGAILLDVTNVLASRCGAGLNQRTAPGGCSGIAAVAHHARGAVTLSVAACAALAVIAFIWYMFWGYKTNGQVTENGGPSGP